MQTSIWNFWILLCFFFPIVGHTAVTTRYVEIKSIHEVAGDILYDPSDFWLILDLDDTLLEGAQALTQFLWLQKTLIGLQQLGFTENEAWNTAYPYWLETGVRFMEKNPQTAVGFTNFMYYQLINNHNKKFII